MATVRPASDDDFDAIYEALFRKQWPGVPRAHWKNLFHYPWRPPDDPCGYVLVDGDRIVGFLGLIFSERRIAGRTEKICNLSSWVVDERYRRESLNLLFPVLRRDDVTVTNLSPWQARIRTIFDKLGFEELERAVYVLLPLPANWLRLDVETDPTVIEAALGDEDRRYFSDHQLNTCRHCLIRSGDATCYLILSKVRRLHVRFSYLHYIGNKSFFLQHSIPIRLALLRHFGNLFTLVDARCLPKRPPAAVPIRFPMLIRSRTLTKSDITDNLYSEYPLLAV